MSAPAFWLWQAAAGVAGAGLLWLGASVLHRLLRVPPASRDYWLATWALAVLPTPLAIGAVWLAPSAVPGPLPVLADLGGMSDAMSTVSTQAAVPTPLSWLAPALLLVYGVGIVIACLRWCAGARALAALLRGARALDTRRLPGAGSRAECETLRRTGVRIVMIDACVSPYAVRWPRPTIALPAALLAMLDDRQLRLVLRHEAAHLAQWDPQRAAVMRAVHALLWFNPFLAAIARRVQLAAELACDAAAIGDDVRSRRPYAMAYLEALRLSSRAPSSMQSTPALPASVSAFSPRDPGGHRMRLAHMLHGDSSSRRHPSLRAVLVAVAVSAGGAVTYLQASTVQASTASAQQVVAFTSPIVAGRLTSAYGGVRPVGSPRMHNGIDLAAARGTPVHAPAGGVVVVATTAYAAGPDYGTVIVLDHGEGWQTLYAHLDGVDVAVGERVVAGQAIGRVGTTGKSTGPHVHVEVHHHGERVDPATVIASPLAAR